MRSRTNNEWFLTIQLRWLNENGFFLVEKNLQNGKSQKKIINIKNVKFTQNCRINSLVITNGMLRPEMNDNPFVLFWIDSALCFL